MNTSTKIISVISSVILINLFSSSCKENNEDLIEKDCFQYKLGAPIPTSNIDYAVIVDEENENLYYFNNLHKDLVRVNILSGEKVVILSFPDLTEFTPFEIVNNSFFSTVSEGEENHRSLLKIDLEKLDTQIISKSVVSIAPIGTSPNIAFEDKAGMIVISDFVGNLTKTDLTGRPIAISDDGQNLLLREMSPMTIYSYNLATGDKRFIKQERQTNLYYWDKEDIIEMIQVDKSLILTNLSEDKIIMDIEDYGFGYYLSTSNNMICFVNMDSGTTTCENQIFSMTVEDINTGKVYPIAESGFGYFSRIHIYKNKKKIMYWYFDSNSYWIDEIE